VLTYALHTGLSDLEQDVERVVIDHAAGAPGFLELLAASSSSAPMNSVARSDCDPQSAASLSLPLSDMESVSGRGPAAARLP